LSARTITGAFAMPRDGETQKDAVRRVAKKIGLSERYVWGCVKLGRDATARVTANVRSRPSPSKPRPYQVAGNFLFDELRSGYRAAADILMMARDAGIAERTLRRQCKWMVKSRRVGGRGGYWTWELSTKAKNFFGPID
jgi:hypothetical protein